MAHRRGVSLFAPLPCGARHGGLKSAGIKGAQGWAPESFRGAKPGGRQAKLAEFLGALACTAAGATLPPLRAFLRSPTSLYMRERAPAREHDPKRIATVAKPPLRGCATSDGSADAGLPTPKDSAALDRRLRNGEPTLRGGLRTVPPGFAVERRLARACRLSMSGTGRCCRGGSGRPSGTPCTPSHRVPRSAPIPARYRLPR